MKKEYKKLVRDNIPKIIIKQGNTPYTEILKEEEYQKEISKKLLEEAEEYLDSGEVEELADVMEVIYAILFCKNISFEELEKIREKKKEARGGFEERIFLREVEEK